MFEDKSYYTAMAGGDQLGHETDSRAPIMGRFYLVHLFQIGNTPTYTGFTDLQPCCLEFPLASKST